MKFITQCVMNDWVVLEPIGDNDRYDCVIDRGFGFERVQVKTGRYQNGTVVFSNRSSHHHTRKGQSIGNSSKDYKNDVDAFGVYCHEIDKCYLVPIDDANYHEMRLRIAKPRNNNEANINWAHKYEI